MNKVIQHMKAKPSNLLILLIILTFPVVYLNLFNAHFMSWDDADYVLDNRDVHQFNLSHFFSKFYVGNYHPLTMISYAIDWKLFGKSSLGYHIENMVWHSINTFLVFVLSQKLLKNNLKAFIVTIIFAFHPNQLETVGWIAERKNLMVACFFLSGILTYIRFLDTQKTMYLVYTFMLFVFALLCKPSAIVFPLILLIIDYLFVYNVSKQAVLKKIPFFILAITLAMITIFAQQSGKFINESHAYPIYERIGYAGYALLQYLNKFLLPINLSVIYPYPTHKIASIIIGYIILTAITFIIYKLYITKKQLVLFGLFFFIINLLLVLQFIPFGEVLTADRYMYLPIIGISIAIISIIPTNIKLLRSIAFLLMIVLGSLSYTRSRVWQSSIALYSDILKKYPHSFVALNSLGAEYMLNKNYELASKYLNTAINENTNYYKGYYNRGLLYAQTNRYEKALHDFNKAIELNHYHKAYVARANVYYALKDLPKAMSDAETVLKTEPLNAKANYVMATCYDDLNELNKALEHYNIAVDIQTDEPMFYLRRAILQGKQQHFEACLTDLNKCTTLNPNFGEAYYWKGVAKVNLKQNPCADLKMAVNLGFTAAQEALTNYCR